MWQLLILLALWLGTLGLGRAELTAAQHQGLQVALEEFHKHPRVQWAFQKTSVDSAMDKVSSTTPGREGVRASPQDPGSRCKRAWVLSAPGSGERPLASHQLGCAASLWGEGTGHIPGIAQPAQLAAAFLCLSVCLSAALPGGDLCEAGIYAPADRLWEEGLEEN